MKRTEKNASGDYDFKVGDIVSAYNKGYWKILEITPRPKQWLGGKTVWEPAPLVTLEKVSNSAGILNRRETTRCDISWCRPATETLALAIAEREKELEQLKNFLATLQ